MSGSSWDRPYASAELRDNMYSNRLVSTKPFIPVLQ